MLWNTSSSATLRLTSSYSESSSTLCVFHPLETAPSNPPPKPVESDLVASEAAEQAYAHLASYSDVYSVFYSPVRINCVYCLARTASPLYRLFPNARRNSVQICPNSVHKYLFNEELSHGVTVGSWCRAFIIDIHGRPIGAVGLLESLPYPEQRVYKLIVPACGSLNETGSPAICCVVGHTSKRVCRSSIPTHDVRLDGLDPINRAKTGLDTILIHITQLECSLVPPPPASLSLYKARLLPSQRDLLDLAKRSAKSYDAEDVVGATRKIARGRLAGCAAFVYGEQSLHELKMTIDYTVFRREEIVPVIWTTSPYQEGDEVTVVTSNGTQQICAWVVQKHGTFDYTVAEFGTVGRNLTAHWIF